MWRKSLGELFAFKSNSSSLNHSKDREESYHGFKESNRSHSMERNMVPNQR